MCSDQLGGGTYLHTVTKQLTTCTTQRKFQAESLSLISREQAVKFGASQLVCKISRLNSQVKQAVKLDVHGIYKMIMF